MSRASAASSTTSRNVKNIFVGDLLCTTYHVSDNTPRGTRATSSGARATEYHTIAVDGRNPIFPMGTKLYVEGFGYGVVEDVGGFGGYGVDLDLFTSEGDGYKKRCKVWIYRPETKEEAEKRLAKIRKKRQKGSFRIIFSDDLVPGTCRVDPEYIKKGAAIVYPGGIIEATSTGKNLRNTIIAGRKRPIFPQKVDGFEFFDTEKLRVNIDVFENVKG